MIPRNLTIVIASINARKEEFVVFDAINDNFHQYIANSRFLSISAFADASSNHSMPQNVNDVRLMFV